MAVDTSLRAGRESSVLNTTAKCLNLFVVCVMATGCQSTQFWKQNDLLKKVSKSKDADCSPDKVDCAPDCAPDNADCAPDCGPDGADCTPNPDPGRPDAGCRDGSCGPQAGATARSAPCPTGCSDGCQVCDFGVPRELKMVSLPDYVIEPPDILLIEVDGTRKAPSTQLSSGEMLEIRVGNTLPIDQFDDEVSRRFKQINGVFRIQSDGHINLGPEYGDVAVRGLSLSDARRLIELHLKRTLKNPRVFITRASEQSEQQIAGEHLVRPDGTVSLGIHGSVYVAGLTLDQARASIERHLSSRLADPRVNLDVLAYNSKVYYVVTDGGGAGEQVFRFPCTGNETVLDALAQINGLPTVASKKDIWISRPAPPSTGYAQVLDVDWDAIVRGAHTGTNYQILPGDRIYVQADDLVTFDTGLAKLTAPLERILGFVLLGHGTVRSVQFGHRGQQNGGF